MAEAEPLQQSLGWEKFSSSPPDSIKTSFTELPNMQNPLTHAFEIITSKGERGFGMLGAQLPKKGIYLPYWWTFIDGKNKIVPHFNVVAWRELNVGICECEVTPPYKA